MIAAECEPPIPQDRIGTTSSAYFNTKGRYTMVRRVMMLLVLVLLVAATPVFAADTTGVGPLELKFLGGALGLGIAGGLCGIGQGRAVGSAAEAMARNPGAGPGIRFVLILGLAFIESLAIYTLAFVFGRY